MASNLSISAAMETAVNNVLSQTSITEFIINVQLTNLSNQSFSYSPLWIDHMKITQNFSGNFTDDIRLEFGAAPQDYQLIYANTQGLVVSIRFVYVNSLTSTRVYTPPPIVRNYLAMLVDPQDLSKKYTTGSLVPTQEMPLTEQHISLRIPVKLNLIEIAAYTLRQQQFHGLFQKAKIADVISYVTKSFNISQLYLVPPDNKMTWQHISIPPSQNVDEIFDYLHHTYGIYMKGIDWYYTNKTLYVYPAFENNPVIKYKANIYNSPNKSYAGILSSHAVDSGSNTTNIVSTTQVATSDISRPSAENTGTGY